MKHRFASLLLVLVVLLVGCVAILAYASKYNSVGRASVEAVLKSVERDQRLLGRYPQKVEIETEEILGVLPGPTIRYLVTGAGCSVYYNQWPLGPKAIKDCGGTEWYFEE